MQKRFQTTKEFVQLCYFDFLIKLSSHLSKKKTYSISTKNYNFLNVLLSIHEAMNTINK